MVWKAPSFWQKTGWPAQALRPLACLYSHTQQALYNNQSTYHSSLPVICVGNIVAGGGGKTPAVHALLDLLKPPAPVILLRGYGGTEKGPLVVGKQDYKQVGDEALLHAARSITIVSADRAAGAKLAEEKQASLIIMDDGFQNNRLVKNISLLVVDEKQGIGNGLCLPAGPLREPLARALVRTDAIIFVGDKMPFSTDKPVFRAHIETTKKPEEKKYIGFCGIGHPDKFRVTLMQAGFTLEDFVAFADHHPYSDGDLHRLKERAKAAQATLITTEKDFIRIPGQHRTDIETLPIRMTFEKANELRAFIEARL